ncbi:thermonuclease family protein, partial [bacterium]|nr:thermonuclease family protein [bacterium]
FRNLEIFPILLQQPHNYIAANNNPVDYSHIFVKKVIDGDTFILSTGERVRFIGIDTPELYESDKLYYDARRSGVSPKKIMRMGKLSYKFTKRLCEGKYVRLEFDNERFDKYGRILAYIFLDDGAMLNERILKQGHGLAYLRFYFRQDYKDRFITAENEAKKLKKGLWNMSPGLKELERLRR